MSLEKVLSDNTLALQAQSTLLRENTEKMHELIAAWSSLAVRANELKGQNLGQMTAGGVPVAQVGNVGKTENAAANTTAAPAAPVAATTTTDAPAPTVDTPTTPAAPVAAATTTVTVAPTEDLLALIKAGINAAAVKNKRDAVVAILNGVGAKNASSVPEDKRAEVLVAINALLGE